MNTTADTKFDHFDWDLSIPVGANGMTSLRAVIEYANANPLNGDWNTNRYDVDLSPIGQQTITLKPDAGFQTLTLGTNFNFLPNAGNVTIERSAAAGTPDFNHFNVSAGKEVHFTGLTLLNGSSTGAGGSVWNVGGTAHFLNCVFVNNKSSTRGGAIATTSGATTVAFECMFAFNSASVGGGAVAALPGSVMTSIIGCTLTGNETAGNGGAVWADGAGSLSIQDSDITWNQATEIDSLGGGVYVEDTTTATITRTSIADNEAGKWGGGMYVFNCNLTMTDGELFHNTSAGSGGGFFVNANGKTVTLNQVSVTDNHAGGLGGGGYVSEGTLAGELLAGQLTGNTADGEGRNGSLPGIGLSLNALRTITVAPGQQKVEVNEL